MSKKIDLADLESLSREDKQYLFDRGRLPEDVRDKFLAEMNTPEAPSQYGQPVSTGPKSLEDMSKNELLREAESRGVKHPKNVSYEKLLSILEEDDEDDEEDSDEDEDSEDDDDEDDE